LPPPPTPQIPSSSQKLGTPWRYIHPKLPPTPPFRIAQTTPRSPESQPQVQTLTFMDSLCTAPITVRRGVQGCPPPPPLISSSFLKEFSFRSPLAALFPRGLLLDRLGFNCSAPPGPGWNSTFPSPPPLSGAAAALSNFWETAISDSLNWSLYCLHVDVPDAGQLICIYSHYPLSAL